MTQWTLRHNDGDCWPMVDTFDTLEDLMAYATTNHPTEIMMVDKDDVLHGMLHICCFGFKVFA